MTATAKRTADLARRRQVRPSQRLFHDGYDTAELVEASSSSTSSTGYITDARRQPAITKSLPMIMAESPAALANHNVREDCPA